MKFHVKINSIKYSISYFSYRINKTADSLALAYNLQVTALSKDEFSIGDILEFYANDELIYSGTVTQSVKFSARSNLQSIKNDVIPAKNTHSSSDIVFYSSSQMRIAQNLNITPFDDVATSVGEFTVERITHYDIYSEFTYG